MSFVCDMPVEAHPNCLSGLKFLNRFGCCMVASIAENRSSGSGLGLSKVMLGMSFITFR